jgi:hypothetical protein
VSSRSPNHSVGSFRGLPQNAAAPNAELSRLRLAKPPPSKSGSLARTCGDGKGARLAFAPQVIQSLSPRLNHDLAAVLYLRPRRHVDPGREGREARSPERSTVGEGVGVWIDPPTLAALDTERRAGEGYS